MDVTVKAADGGTFSAYCALPKTGRGPGVLVIQEIFGVNAVMRGIADHYAAQGYVALCPDLFWRQEPGIQITDQTEAEWQKAFALYKGFDEAKGVSDLIRSLAFLRSHGQCTGKVGTVGFCLGGKLAYLMACRSDAEANVGYYGVGIEGALDEAKAIRSRLLLHIAEKDGFVPAEAQAKVRAALGPNPLATLHTHPGVDHAFARAGGKNHNARAAALASTFTAAFFQAYLS